MHCAGVVGFHRVFNKKLPVALGLDFLAPGNNHVVHVVRSEQIGEIADVVLHGRRVVAVVDENKSRPGLQPDRQQSIFGLVKPFGLFHRRRGQHSAIQTIAPGVVWTKNHARGAAAFQQQCTAVAAEIRESAQRAGIVAHDQDRTAHCLDRTILTGICPLIDTPDDDPAARMDVFDLGLEERFRRIAIGRKATGLRQGRALPDVARSLECGWFGRCCHGASPGRYEFLEFQQQEARHGRR